MCSACLLLALPAPPLSYLLFYSNDEAIKEFITKVDSDVRETRAAHCDCVILHRLDPLDLFIDEDTHELVQDRISCFLNCDIQGKTCTTEAGQESVVGTKKRLRKS